MCETRLNVALFDHPVNMFPRKLKKRQTNRQAGRQTDRQTDRHTDRPTDRQTQPARQTDRRQRQGVLFHHATFGKVTLRDYHNMKSEF